MKAGRSGSCKKASIGTREGKDRETTAVRPILGATEDGRETGNEIERDGEMAERLAGEELDKEEAAEKEENGGEEAERSKGITRGTKPSKKEVEEHERTHCHLGTGVNTVYLGRPRAAHTGKQRKGKGRSP